MAGRCCVMASMPFACYEHAMSNMQVKNVPDGLHRKLRRHAKRRGRTIRDFVLEAVRRELERDEFHDRLARRASIDLGRPAARTVEETRGERDRELGL